MQKDNSPNLNTVRIEHHQVDNVDTGVEEATSFDGSVTIYFRRLEEHLIDYIRDADVILGCVAWLTNPRVLAALAEAKSVAIVVQKEDFLRPDLNAGHNWRSKLRQMYNQLHCPDERFTFPRLMGKLSVGSDPTMHSVRCVGNCNRDKSPAFPRMHHKFILLCRYQDTIKSIDNDCGWNPPSIIPYAVWTGSFNFTENAVRSLENALLLKDPNIVWAYYDEWARIEAISEELDWTSDWAVPEWRIGT